MRILIIRHGQPNYELDCLTETGRREAEMLADRIEKMKIDSFFVSPMGRARETCEITVKRLGVQAEVCDWLHEFDVKSAEGEELWDICPEKWTADKLLFDKDTYLQSAFLDAKETGARAEAIKKGIDGILARYGYVRKGGAYISGRNDATIALYCHFGAGCVTIAHLLGISPMLTLQGFSCEPTAVAMLCSDERFDGLVNFRLHSYGDISHLGKTPDGGVVAYK